MKKFIAISMIGLFLVSCKKDYSCWCSTPKIYVVGAAFVTQDTKKAATKKCDEKQTELRTKNPATDPDDEWSCVLR
ncbi:MAG: hypothetical protein KF900_09045 [Bacteroidetes bacterium]|nr:hypothetical protein [Bacteroidota bacterium]